MNPRKIQWATFYWRLSHLIFMSYIYTGSMYWGSKFCWFKNSYESFVHRFLPPAYIFWLWCPRNILRRHVLAVVCAGMARNGNNSGKFPSDSAATTARSARGWSGVNCSHQSGHQCHQPGWGASRGAQRLSKYLWTFQLKQQQQLGSGGCWSNTRRLYQQSRGLLRFPGR